MVERVFRTLLGRRLQSARDGPGSNERKSVDFEYHYTQEQERFRREVRGWLGANLPQEVKRSGELGSLDHTTWEQCKSFQRRLGEKGWLAPTDPVEWGGGGLTSDQALILREEMRRSGLQWLLEDGSSPLRSALLQQGTEEQKRRYLPLISGGGASLWHISLEPGAELDTSSLGIQAFRDGDDYVLNGEGTFIGQGLWPDYLWTLALTDPDAPSSQATATFLLPAGLEGILIQTPGSLAPEENHRVTFKQVWVPPHCLLGDDDEGWPLMQATLLAGPEIDYPSDHDEEVADLLQYARETTLGGVTLSKEPFLQQLLMEAHINSQLVRILRKRNAWMAATGQQLTYHTAQVALMEKRAALRLSQIVREVMGIYALLDHEDPRSPFHGRFERHQRRSLTRQNPTGGSEVQAAAIAKHVGLGHWSPAGGAPSPEGLPMGAFQDSSDAA
ncbi:MAG: Acyl-CoA dh protein [Dehalococcoidia bacterium]|nr:Acyl-CoA dh protein [Dehalococcoidia bacterium]